MSTEMRDDDAPLGTVESLLDGLRAVIRDAEALLRATEGTAGEHIEEARARAEESLNGARRRMRDAGAGMETSAREAASAADRYVRANPWTAVAVAAGIGYLLGQIGRRR